MKSKTGGVPLSLYINTTNFLVKRRGSGTERQVLPSMPDAARGRPGAVFPSAGHREARHDRKMWRVEGWCYVLPGRGANRIVKFSAVMDAAMHQHGRLGVHEAVSRLNMGHKRLF